MNLWAKISLSISAFSLIIMIGARFILGGWHTILYAFLALFLVGLILSVILDYKLFLNFLSVKTAKKGLSLGWSLLLLIVFLLAFGYLGNRFNKSFDVTEEGLNSLSQQSLQILKRLDSPLTVYIFYKGDKISQQMQAFKTKLKEDLNLYKQNSSKVKVAFIDTYKNNAKAEEYLSNLPDKNQQELFVFINYKNRKIRVDSPWAEESFTSAIIKAQKRGFKEILFLTGHGEKKLDNAEPSGLQILNQSLKDSGFILKEWNLIEQGFPTKPSALVMIVSPVKPFLEEEMQWLESYLSQGGSLFISLDPKENSLLEGFLKNYGVVFNNNFILNQVQIFGVSAGVTEKAMGSLLDKKNPITKPLKQAVIFDKSSSLDILPSAFEKFKFSYLVRSQNSFTADNLQGKIKMKELESLTMALEVKPKSAVSKTNTKKDDKDDHDDDKDEDYEKDSDDKDDKTENKSKQNKEFQLVVFGDSDFLTNRYVHMGANKDLALNTVVSMTGEEELVSIRPRLPKGTKINLNRPQRMSLIILYISMPILFLITGLWMWLRRRSA